MLTGLQVSSALAEAELAPIPEATAGKLAEYGNVLLKWNERMNLTSIREEDGLLQRHLIESVAAAQALPAGITTLLDYGSGAGIPGIPIALCRPEVAVTLAESQLKKVAFLREAARVLGLPVAIFSGRVEQMPAEKRFSVVILRAVDKMEEAVPVARRRVASNGILALFTTPANDMEIISPLRFASVEMTNGGRMGSLGVLHVERSA